MSIRAPAEIDWLVSAVGEKAVFVFVESECGRTMWVPARAAGSALEARYGSELATAVCARHARSSFRVPMLKRWRIRCHRLAGMMVADIAARVGVSERYVYAVLSGERGNEARIRRPARPADTRQISLF
ncbi:hypothetical protein Geu3261_0208_011 [Komagataeibacter europaeus NBRC 3261]|uniref:Uncharacterized protein n=1 Tax=Komagataeibacter europaeus NBRC 3261 TaxID=1234669 RepID=A0A0D6Q2P4_KOMEU|nr:hypothetical protein [Komagataeibacter europaeus]GAN97578.1 hypothetical protein Geu3261_0208_011 [Komagataeibacter europaeus NBRC 3261]